MIRIIKAPLDPIATRISVGGNSKVGTYCVYRGTRHEALKHLRLAVAELETLQAEPPIEHYNQLSGEQSQS